MPCLRLIGGSQYAAVSVLLTAKSCWLIAPTAFPPQVPGCHSAPDRSVPGEAWCRPGSGSWSVPHLRTGLAILAESITGCVPVLHPIQHTIAIDEHELADVRTVVRLPPGRAQTVTTAVLAPQTLGRTDDHLARIRYIDEDAPARGQGAHHARQHVAVGRVILEAKATTQQQYRLKLVLITQLAHVALLKTNHRDVFVLGFQPAMGNEAVSDVHAQDGQAACGQPARMVAAAAGQIQDPVARPEVEYPDDQVDRVASYWSIPGIWLRWMTR